jgi:Zn-dependent peptidase ImmA (M78 family)
MGSTLHQLRELADPLKRLSAEEARKLAEAQAERLLRLSGVTGPPVGERIIAELPNVQIERIDAPKSFQAAVKWSDGRWLILVNGRMTRASQRFSVAHELKHILDHPFVTILYERQQPKLAHEACEYFAACLLMPRRWMRAAWAEDQQDERSLARRFGVSVKALKVRLLQLKLIEPTALCVTREA